MATIPIGMPISMVVMSIGSFIILGAWLLELNWSEKWARLKSNSYTWLLVGLFFIHILGLLYTTDIKYAINDLRIKLPLLIFPVIIGSMPPINRYYLRIILLLFILSVLISTLISFYFYLFDFDPLIGDVHTISRFVSHIRFSLMIVISILFLIYLIKSDQEKMFFKIIFLIVTFWFVYFLYLLQSATGWICLLFGSLFVGFWIVKSKSIRIRLLFYALTAVGIILIALYINNTLNNFTKQEVVNFSTLEKKTKYGESYLHDLNNNLSENGHFIYLYVAPKELEATWNERSKLSFTGKDKKQQPLSATLIRFLASKGLRKDRDGLLSLSGNEILDIENGKTSCSQGTKNSIEERLNKVFFELKYYSAGGNSSGHSVAQRIEYLKTGLTLVNKNFFFGVGTGDVQIAFDKEYEESKSSLDLASRHRAHNQYLTMQITFGVLGSLFFFFVLIYPLAKTIYRNDYFFISFYLIILLSFINEDTLETQAGVTLFSFFCCLFILSSPAANRTIEK